LELWSKYVQGNCPLSCQVVDYGPLPVVPAEVDIGPGRTRCYYGKNEQDLGNRR
jgi:hypothetical protein